MSAIPTAEPRDPSRAGSRASLLLLVALLAGSWLLMVASVREKGLTFDEGIHLAGGVAYWKLDDFRINPENGNLPQRLMALPMVLGNFRFPPTEQAAWYRSDGWRISDQFLYDMGNDSRTMLLRGRATMALLAVILGWVVFAWSRRLFGWTGGIISLVLFVLNPTTLAHGPLMTSDMAGALFFLASVGCLWTVLHHVSPRTVIASGLVMGGLFASKMSSPLIVPVGVALILIRLARSRDLELTWGRRIWQVRGRAKQAALFATALIAHALIVALVIWGSYGFRYEMFRDARPGRDQPYRPAVLEQTDQMPGPIRFARDWRLLPEAYIYGQTYVIRAAQARLAFLNGEVRLEGWRSFFPYSFMVKTPLTVFGVMILAALGAWAARPRPVRAAKGKVVRAPSVWTGLYETAPLWTFMGIYWLTAINSHLNIGHRHLLPIYAPMFVLAGASAHWLNRSRKAMAATLLAMLALLVFESLVRFPDYLAYFNQIVGGPRNGYRHMVDSSLDWGQDLPGLKTYLQSHGLEGGGTRVFLSYFGRDRPESYGIHADRLDRPAQTDASGAAQLPVYAAGVYCISATNLQPVVLTPAGPWNRQYEDLYQRALADERRFAEATGDSAARARLGEQMPEDAWLRSRAFLARLRSARFRAYLRQREPDDQVHHSILIYRVSAEQVRQALEGPMPEDGPSLLQQVMGDG